MPEVDYSDPSIRDEKGRWKAGACPGGPGRPKHRDEYLSAWQRGCSYDDLTEIATRITADAKLGDLTAATLLARYLLPAPARTDDGDTPGMLTAEAFVLLRAKLKEELRAEIQAEMAQRPDDWHPRKKLLDE